MLTGKAEALDNCKFVQLKTLRGLQVQTMGFRGLDWQPSRHQVIEMRLELSFAIVRVTLFSINPLTVWAISLKPKMKRQVPERLPKARRSPGRQNRSPELPGFVNL